MSKYLKKTQVSINEWQEAHSHVVFVNEDRGYGHSSFDAQHSHELQWVPETEEVPEQQDPMTGEIIPGQPAQPGYWQWTPGPDGHVHDELVEIPAGQVDLADETDDEKVADVLHLFNTWYESERASILQGRESEEFRSGKQWPDGVRTELERQRRACLTVNIVDPKINALCGYERQQRQELKYLPQEAGDQKAADLYNVLVKKLTDQCFFPMHKSSAFEDAATAGKGSFNIRVSFDNDLRGEVIIERFPWDQSIWAPSEYPDGSDSEGFCKYRWYSLAKAKKLWPEHRESLEAAIATFDALDPAVRDTMPGAERGGPLGGQTPSLFESRPMLDVEARNVLVVECHRLEWVKVPVLFHYQDDFAASALGWDKRTIEAVRTIPGFQRIERSIKKIRITKVAGGKLLLSDEFPADLPSDEFHLVPFYANRKRGQYWGKVEPLKGVQLQMNKFASQSVDIGNRMSAWTYFIDSSTFPDGEKQRFLNNSAEPGAVFEVNNVNNLPSKFEGVRFPSEIVQLMQIQLQHADLVFPIQPDNIGANTSGQAIMQAQKQKLLGMEHLFDSLRHAMMRIGKLLIPIIKKYYPPERIARIVRALHATTPVMVSGQPLDEFTDEQIVAILSEADLEKFDLVVAETAYSPTARLSTFMILSEMMQRGVQIPPEMLLEYADMPQANKDKVMQMLAEQNAAQNEAAAKSGDGEIEKTLVAKGIIPPAVAERMGLPQQNGTPMAPVAGQEQMDGPPQ